MAKKKEQKPKQTSKAYTAPLLPEAMTLFIRRSLWRAMGLVLGMIGVGIIASLYSYNPADPNFNTASGGEPTNLLGAFGAYSADLMLQTLGLAVYALALPMFTWCWRIVRLRTLPLFWINLALIPLALLLISAAYGAVRPAPDWPIISGYGGVIGQWLNQQANTLTALVGLIVPLWTFALIFGVLGILALAGSLGLTRQEWHSLLQWLIYILRRTISAVSWGLYNGYHWLAARLKRETSAYAEGDDTPATRRVSSPRQRNKREMHEPPIVQEKAKTTPGKREKKEAQRAFDLGDSSGFKLPPLDMLTPTPVDNESNRLSADALEANARMLESVLDDFGVKGEIINVRPGPVVTLYELEPAPGVKAARVIGLSDDIARSMSAISARVAVVPGRNVIGIELPNAKREMVAVRELFASRDFESSKSSLPLLLGKDIGGEPIVADLASMPHLLVAGTTGAGKSVGLNTMILSLLYRLTPEQVRLIMVDPKKLELSVYDGIPHLLTPVVTDAKKAVVALKWAVREMEERYGNMAKLGVRNLAAYNKMVKKAVDNGQKLTRTIQTGFDKETGKPLYEDQEFDFETLPLIVIVIDEMADLMLVAGKDVEATVQRLAQMARAAGIHVVMATQRPSVDVITGTIKANFPTRISFRVTSKIDSRTILGEQGAEQLLGMGDMLFMSGGGQVTRVHGAFVSDEEVEDVVNFLKAQGAPAYVNEVTEEPEDGFDSPFIPGPSGESSSGDDLYDKAVDIVIRDQKASTSYIQRRLKIGYNRAATLMEELEENGVVSSANHAGKREILVPNREEEF